MTTWQALMAFVAAASLLTITPGVDTAMVLRAATTGGTRPAWLAAAGIGMGCLVWGTAVSVGLGALLTASQTAYTLLKWAGAAYLAWLGAGLLLGPRTALDDTAPGRTSPNSGQWLRQGLLTNLLNPKIGVFYVTFLPQFIPAGRDVTLFSLGLAAIHVVLGTLWFAILIAATRPIQRQLRRHAAHCRGGSL